MMSPSPTLAQATKSYEKKKKSPARYFKYTVNLRSKKAKQSRNQHAVRTSLQSANVVKEK